MRASTLHRCRDELRRLPCLVLVLALVGVAGSAVGQAIVDTPVAADAATADAATTVDARRAAILDVARAYAMHAWTASEDNTLHGPDVDGVHVDTPDVTMRPDGFFADGRTNVGVPYKWGGFSTLDQFDAGVAAGLPAGQLTDGIKLDSSSHALGVDCSGFVAQCWDLPFKQSTRSLGRLCFELETYAELRPGDLINKYDAHAMLFVEFADAEHTRVRVIEATLPRVMENVYAIDKLETAGFRPFRYKPLDERWVEVPVPDGSNADVAAGRWVAGRPDVPERARPEFGEAAARERLDAVADLLAGAGPGDWARYREGADDTDPLLVVTRAVAAVDAAGIELQSTTELAGRRLETLEEHSPQAGLVDRLLAVRDHGQPYDELTLVDARVTPGRWIAGDRELAAQRIQVTLEGSLTARSQVLPCTLVYDVIVSPEVPLEGIVRFRHEAEYLIEGQTVGGATTRELVAYGWADDA